MSQDKPIVKEYSKGEITVVWQPAKCIHSEICFHGLSDVFDPKNRPWVNLEGATSDEIMAQINKCPSGALSFYKNDEGPASEVKNTDAPLVEVIPNGPLMVHGKLSIKDTDGQMTEGTERTAFCRCGASSNKPYCDGSHKKVGFKG